MNYELAKKLEEAGFGVGFTHIDMIRGEKETYYPTLEELIEACGENFIGLDRLDVGFNAIGDMPGGLAQGEGPIPTEAVARLWLALNAPVDN